MYCFLFRTKYLEICEPCASFDVRRCKYSVLFEKRTPQLITMMITLIIININLNQHNAVRHYCFSSLKCWCVLSGDCGNFCVQFNIDKKVACDFYLFVFPFTYTGKNESFTVYVYVCVIKSLSSSATPIRPNCRLPPSINADG